MHVGFLPVIPKYSTNPATVHKAFENFENVRKQVLPICCDDGVFSPAVDMFSPVFFEPETFKNLFLMLGPFHWAKVLLHFAGPLCAGFGIEDSLMDCEVFGPIVLNSVMSRGHCLVNDWYSHDRGRHVQIGVGGTLAPVQWRWKKRWDSRRRRKIQKNLRCYLRISKMLMLIMLSLLSKLNASHVWRFDNIWMRD